MAQAFIAEAEGAGSPMNPLKDPPDHVLIWIILGIAGYCVYLGLIALGIIR
jgi:hypothetical protein